MSFSVNRHVLRRESVARLHVGEFRHGDDVTCLGFGDRRRLFAAQHQERVQLLF